MSDQALTSREGWSSYFVFTAGQGRVRRPRDVLTAVVGFVLVGGAVVTSDSSPLWSRYLADLVADAPQWVQGLASIGYLVSLVYMLVVVIGLVSGGKERIEATRDLILVVVGTLGLVIALSMLVNGTLPYFLPEIDLQDPVPQFPVTRVALVTAILLVVAPYVTRPLRRFGWLAIAVTAMAAIALNYGTPNHTVGSFGVGMLVAGLLLVAVGTPLGYPAPASVALGLDNLGVPNRNLRQWADQDWGMVRFTAEDRWGTPLDIKVHGRDSFDSQLASKVWRTLMYREIGRTVTFTRQQAVEHEALVTLMAGRAGVAVPELRAVGNASSEIALIAFESQGTPLRDLDESQLGDDLLVELWQMVGNLHDANINHGQLRTESVRVVDGKPRLVDLGLGSLAPEDDDRAGDIVELLFSLAMLVGAERSVATAHRGLGGQALVEVLPYLQVPAVSADSRRQAAKPKQLIAELSEAALSLTGADKPEPIELRRVSWKTLLTVGLVLLVGSALVPVVTGVDYAEIWAVLEGADWVLVVLAVVVGQIQFFPSAASTMFAVTAKLPYWPLVILQTASQFISLAVPSAAGRVAMNAAFLRKFGVPVAAAVAQGAIDSFSGFLVQAVIMLVVLLTGDVDLGFQVDPNDVPWLMLLLVLAGVAMAVVFVVWRVRKIRERVVPIVRQAWGAWREVLKQPSRAVGMLLSNFVFWNVLGLTLWILLSAVGSPLSYGSTLFIAAGTSLLAGFVPVPGGVGVAEATMASLLATFGVDQSAALAVTFTYRAITFYLPALQGLFGARWLERNDYI